MDEGKLREQQRLDPAGTPSSIADVEKWLEDYLRKIYEHIQFRLAPQLGQLPWENAKVEFIFSVPTTWAPNPTVERFRKIIERSGYSRYATHSVSIGLTEAEAAAVWTAKEISGIFKVE